MKTALVLGGGGSRGSYQIGVLKALEDLDVKYDMIVGTSIGALNGALIIQDGVDKLIDIWETISIKDIIKGELPNDFSMENLLTSKELRKIVFKEYTKNKVDITPFKKFIKRNINVKKIKDSNIDFNFVTVKVPQLKAVFLNKEDLINNPVDTLLATSACFPAFPIHEYNKENYIDGGYHDNCAINYALRLGATKVIAVDLDVSIMHKKYIGYPNINYLYPKESIGSILNFERSLMKRNQIIGYNDCLKAYNKLDGFKYSFKKIDDEILFDNIYQIFLSIESQSEKRFANHHKLWDKLTNDYNKQVLSIKEVSYRSIEYIMELLNYDTSNIYELNKVINDIVIYFKDDLSKNTTDNVLEFVDIVIKNFASLDKLSIIKKTVNVLKNPNNYKGIEHFYLDMDSFTCYLGLLVLLFEDYINE